MPKRKRAGAARGGTAAASTATVTGRGALTMHMARQLADGADTGCGVFMLIGAGIEMDGIEPNVCHALAALVACTGGVLVSTNITDAMLLALPVEHPKAAFVAPHGTMCDQQLGRGLQRRRPRSHGELGLPLLEGRSVYTKIPITVDDTDPNVQECRRAAASPECEDRGGATCNM